ncbi:MAG: hypothetical protein H8D70_00915 [Rhodospirillaceae bacterium]|nr:hypothetical protein [Rhodospirillaceae bacterium]
MTYHAAARTGSPILYRFIPLLAVFLAICISWLWTLSASAQTCDYPATGKSVIYAAPPDGTKITFEDVTLRAKTEQTRRELAFTSGGGTPAETEWTIQMASGQAIAVRTFLGLLQTANSSGTASDFDRNRYATLWPLDAGKSVDLSMNTITQRGTQYTSTLSLCVRRYETLKLPAGKFETVVIDAHRQITSGGEALPFDEVYTRYWYVPQFGIYLQRVRAMYRQRQEVMKQTRRAISVSGRQP